MQFISEFITTSRLQQHREEIIIIDNMEQFPDQYI